MRLRYACLAAFAACVLLAGGCGKGKGANKPVPVEGVLTLEGKPIPNVTLVFQPTGGGQSASGVSGSDGKYRLTTFNTGDGAPPGEYKITAVLMKEEPAGSAEARKPGGAEYMKAMMSVSSKGGTGKASSGPSSELHPNYADPNKSPLKATIPEGGNTSLNLDLKKTGS